MASAGSGRGEAGEPPAVDDANTAPLAEGGEGRGPATGGVPRAVLKATATKSPTEAAELLRADAGDIEATTVAMERSGADRVSGQRVIMTRSGARRLEARSAQLERSGVVSLVSDHAVLHAGSAVGVVADEVRMVKSRALVVAAKEATVEEGARVLVYVGPPAAGLKPTVGLVGAAGFGAAFGLVALGLGWLGRRLFRRTED